MTDPAPDLAQRKQELRDRLRFRRRHFAANLDPMARLAAFRALPAPLAVRLAEEPLVGGYAPWGDEPDILPALAGIAARGALALPHHAARDAAMAFRRCPEGAALVRGPWGSPQPGPDTESAIPSILFVPLVGFDRHGGRLGQGGGHYDRFLADHPSLPRIGVGWSVQEVDALPVSALDAPLDAIWTEQEFILCGDRL